MGRGCTQFPQALIRCTHHANANRREPRYAAGGATPTTPTRSHRPTRQRRQSPCARCLEPIDPAEDWHLDHNDARDGYLGVSHARCNLAAGAHKTNGNRPTPQFKEHPYKWSQRWFDDPPIGTINYDGGRNPEIHVGNGEWVAY